MLSDNVLYKLVSCSDLKKKKKKCMRTSLFIKTNGIQDNVQVFFYVQDSVDCCGSSTLM